MPNLVKVYCNVPGCDEIVRMKNIEDVEDYGPDQCVDHLDVSSTHFVFNKICYPEFSKREMAEA